MTRFRTIQLPYPEGLLACTVATKVLQPDIRNLKDIADRICQKGYDWCIANKDPEKDDSWWKTVKTIHEHFSWDRLLEGDPITAKVHGGSFEFGSINGYGGGCHRTIAVAVLAVSDPNQYRPFDIELYCG